MWQLEPFTCGFRNLTIFMSSSTTLIASSPPRAVVRPLYCLPLCPAGAGGMPGTGRPAAWREGGTGIRSTGTHQASLLLIDGGTVLEVTT